MLVQSRTLFEDLDHMKEFLKIYRREKTKQNPEAAFGTSVERFQTSHRTEFKKKTTIEDDGHWLEPPTCHTALKIL